MNFNNNDFQQILFVCPFYYIYQSINKISRGIELKYIDIPSDYIQRMNKKYNLRTNFTLMQTPKKYEPIKAVFFELINKEDNTKGQKLLKYCTERCKLNEDIETSNLFLQTSIHQLTDRNVLNHSWCCSLRNPRIEP